MGFEHAAGFIELDVDAVVGFLQFGDGSGAGAGFIRHDGKMDFAADVFGLFEHVSGHGLLDELDALRLQPVDFADGFFLIRPTFVGVDAKRLSW